MKSVWDEMAEEKMAQGIAKGEEKAKEGFVQRMLKGGEFAIDKIAEYSGLSIARVQEIAKALA